MSLFDSIRYPISCPPTPEQIKALPKKIRGKWLEYLRIHHRTDYHFYVASISNISPWRHKYERSKHNSDEKITSILRRWILEYNGEA